MNRADSVGALARKAALLLHALAPADRQQMLLALAEPERAQLQGLLDELRSLGIPADQDLLQPLLAPEPAIAAPEAAALAQLLQHEPPALVARLLAMDGWPGREPLRAALPVAIAPAVGRPAPALDEALVDAVAHTLRSLPPVPAPRRPRPWRRLWSWS